MTATDFAISVHDDVPASEGAIVDEGLGAANLAAAPLHEVRPVSCFARDVDGRVIGGAVGRTWGRCCELQQLWVAVEHRRRGLGRRLVERLHERAEARGCTLFFLETFTFQAPALYASLGYESAVVLEGFAEGVAKHVMVRRVAES